MSDNEYEGGEGETCNVNCYSFHRNMPRIVNIEKKQHDNNNKSHAKSNLSLLQTSLEDMKRFNLDLDNKTFPPFNFILWCGTGIFLLGWVDFRLFAIFDIQ